MIEPRRIDSTVEPKVFENLGNGKWYYNFDIKSEEVPSIEGDKTEIRYDYIQIKLSEKPSYKKCVELIVREFITQSQEFDLINSFNRVQLMSGLEDESIDKITSQYKEYLELVDTIKKKIKEDIKKLP